MYNVTPKFESETLLEDEETKPSKFTIMIEETWLHMLLLNKSFGIYMSIIIFNFYYKIADEEELKKWLNKAEDKDANHNIEEIKQKEGESQEVRLLATKEGEEDEEPSGIILNFKSLLKLN